MKGILIIGSIDDGAYSRKFERLTEDSPFVLPGLEDYLIHYEFVCHDKDEFDEFNHIRRTEKDADTYGFYLNRLWKKLFRREYVFVYIHTGIAFYQNKDIYGQLICDLYGAFKDFVEFILEDQRQKKYFSRMTFAENTEIRELVQILSLKWYE